MKELDKTELDRYSRQIALPEIGERGQRRLKAGKVLVVGAGGLGSPALVYLAGAGVGTIGIVDSEEVSLSNLHRQFLHAENDIGRPKVDSAREKLENINRSVNIITFSERLSPRNIDSIVERFDAVVDGSDNFPTRYALNDSCTELGKALFHGGILGFGGQVMSILPGKGPCFRCVFPKPPCPAIVPNCDYAGVMNAAAGVIGSIMAAEAIKFLTGVGELLCGRLLVFDGANMRFRLLETLRRVDCPSCGKVK